MGEENQSYRSVAYFVNWYVAESEEAGLGMSAEAEAQALPLACLQQIVSSSW